MKKSDIVFNFLKKLPYTFTSDGFSHYAIILSIIYTKIMNPDKPESKFVTLCFNEEWEKAESFADTRNKEAFRIGLFQEFNKYIKSSPEYIQKQREDKLNNILN